MKELIEHIRTVHLTVLTIVLIMTAALQLQKEPIIERAADDAEAILRISERWQELPSLMNSEIAKSYSERPSAHPANAGFMPPADDQLTDPGEYLVNITVSEHDPALRELIRLSQGEEDDKAPGTPRQVDAPLPLTMSFITRSSWLMFRRSGTDVMRITDLPRWRNIKEFFQFFEDVRTQNIVILPLQLRPYAGTNGCPQVQVDHENDTHSGEEPAFMAKYEGSSQWTVTPVISLKLLKSSEKAKSFNGHTESSLDRLEHTYSCTFHAYSQSPIPLHLGRMFTPLTPQASRWGDRSSSVEFTALLSSAKFLEETPLPSLASSLRQRSTENTETIELFQAKMPASAIPTFGSLVLIMCMFYLYAQLHELQKLVICDANDPPPGYIGLYSGVFVICFTAFSLTLFPCLPLAIVVYRNSGMLLALSIASIIGVFALGVLSCRALFATRTTLRQRPQIPKGSSLT